MEQLLIAVTEPLRHKVEAQYLSRRRRFAKAKKRNLDDATIDEELMREFDADRQDVRRRILIVPGKDALAKLNEYLQNTYEVSISSSLIVECFRKDDIPPEIAQLVQEIEDFCKRSVE